MNTNQLHNKFAKLAFIMCIVLMLATVPFVTVSLAQQAVKEVKIGAIHPLTGFLARAGGQLKEGLDLAVEEINAAGGIKSLGGAKLVVLHSDS